MELKTEISRYSADIRLSIKMENYSKLMETIRLESSYNQESLVKEAVLFAIECDKPQALKTLFSTYPKQANFSYFQSKEGKVDFDYSVSNDNNCPIVRAASLQKWACVHEIATIIYNKSLGNAAYGYALFVNQSGTKWKSNEYVCSCAIEAKQYDLIRLLLNAGVDINRFDFMNYAVNQKDAQLIQIGFSYNASYNKKLVDNELFASQWQIYQTEQDKNKKEEQQRQQEERRKMEELERRKNEEKRQREEEQAKIEQSQLIPKQRIKDFENFLNGYKSIAVTATFFTNLNMDEMVKNIRNILASDAFTLEEKVERADKAVLSFLEKSSQMAIEKNSWEAFDWQTKVLGLGEIWVWGKVQYNVLNEDHVKYYPGTKLLLDPHAA